jgi:hypothetical protein
MFASFPKRILPAGIAIAMSVGVADAAPIFIFGPENLASAANNNGISSGAINNNSLATPWFGGDGSGVQITFTNPYEVTWWGIGAESGFQNTFSTGGLTATENGASGTGSFPIDGISTATFAPTNFPGDTVSYASAPAGTFIPFSFTNPPAQGSVTVSNGQAFNDSTGPGEDAVTVIFAYATVVKDILGNITSIVLSNVATEYFVAAFDDSGAGPDDNHDDFMVLGRVDEVPIPPAILLFLTGLVGVSWLGRRKSSTVAA